MWAGGGRGGVAAQGCQKPQGPWSLLLTQPDVRMFLMLGGPAPLASPRSPVTCPQGPSPRSLGERAPAVRAASLGSGPTVELDLGSCGPTRCLALSQALQARAQGPGLEAPINLSAGG